MLQVLKEKADFDSYKPRPFNMREFYDRTGHDIKDMLLACHYRGSECSAEDFTVVSGDLVGIALVAHLKVFLHPYPTNADQPTNQPTNFEQVCRNPLVVVGFILLLLLGL